MASRGQDPRHFNVYLASESVGSLDSFEGIPDPIAAFRKDDVALKTAWQRSLHRRLESLSDLAPGLLLAGTIALIASFVAQLLGTVAFGLERSPVSPILVTVLLGLLLRNSVGLPPRFRSGLTWCVKVVLRLGVALLGLRLSLAAVAEIGLHALPIVAASIAAALIGSIWLGRKAGLSSQMSSLIAVGTSVCGVSAIVATGPAVEANDDEVSYAVAVITLFGLLSLLLYPYLAHCVFQGDPTLAGYFLGTAIHDTSQVAGAGLLYQSSFQTAGTLEVAATTKLVRNLSLGLLIPLLTVLHQQRRATTQAARRLPLRQAIPGFVLFFLALAAFRSLGDLGERPFGFLSPDLWNQFLQTAGRLSLVCLTLAMAAIGLGTSITQLRGLGWKPLLLGFAAALLVGLVSGTLIHWIAR